MDRDDRWERDALTKIALEVVKEQRRARRWSIFFRLVLLGYLLALLALVPSCEFGGAGPIGPHTAIVRINGAIMEDSPAGAPLVMAALNRAYEAEGVAGIILSINSPGGSPVQAGRINDELERLRALHPDIPVYTVVGDLCASAAYYIAVGADAIYVDKASLVGSIGVLMDGFGFTELMENLGVERRLLTAGEHKDFLDPFSPVDPEAVAHAKNMLDEIHEQFVQQVVEGRGDRLDPHPNLFSGLIWTGEQSIELGLADELGSVASVAREVIGVEEVVDYTPRLNLISRFADELGASVVRWVRFSAASLR